MLVGKIYRTLDRAFLLLANIFDRVFRIEKSNSITRVHTMCFKLLPYEMRQQTEIGIWVRHVSNLKRDNAKFKSR